MMFNRETGAINMDMDLNIDNFLSAEFQEKRKRNWDAFFSRIENSTSNIDIPVSSLGTCSESAGYLLYDTESKKSLSKQNIKSMYKSCIHKFKKSRKRIKSKFKEISKQWRLLHKVVCNNGNEKCHQLISEIDKLEAETTNGISESNISTSSGSSLINKEINLNNSSSVHVTNHNTNLIRHIDDSKKIESNYPCDIVNRDKKSVQIFKGKQLIVVIEKLNHTKNICKRITSKNGNNIHEKEIPREKENNKESQIDTNYTNAPLKTQERNHKQQKFLNNENIEIKTLSNVANIDDNITKIIECKQDTNSKNTCKVLLDSRLCNIETKYKSPIELCDKLQCSEKSIRNKSSQNGINEKQEILHNEIKTTEYYTQGTDDSVYSTNKRKNYSGFSDTLEQTTKKRKTITLHDLINESMTKTSRIKIPKPRETDEVIIINKQIEYTDVNVIHLSFEELFNGTF